MWSESRLKLGPSFRHLVNAKEEVRKLAHSATKIPIDVADPTGKGGNVNKGDTCRAYLTKHRNILVSLVPDRYQMALNELICRIWVCIRVYTCSESVNVEEYRIFSLETYKQILANFDNGTNQWINISPTVHSLLAHGWELVKANGGVGLGEYSEQGLENNNKFLRYYRQHLARKNSQSNNLDDCLIRLWLKSDPKIRATSPKPVCRHCKIAGHFTVSCPSKSNQLSVSGADTLDEHYYSILIG